jgi:IclR family pca regulon transcriptional regulator
MGRVLLAWADVDVRERAIGLDTVRAFTPRTVTDPNQLREILRDVREQGWAMVDGEVEHATAGISVPVMGQGGKPTFALNVSLNTNRVPAADLKSRCLPELIAVASEIQSRMPRIAP